MSEHANDGTLKPDHERPKGEYKMIVLLLIISGALFVNSLASEGIFQGNAAGPGSIPQLASGILLLMLIALAIQLFRRGYREGTFGDLVHHLFDREVVILLLAVTLYGLVVETIHFVAATFVFLVATMYLLEPKKLWMKLAVSAGTLGLLYLIFATLFQVVLP
jgi:putative tricarboxylic transport membrane protein